MDLLFVRAIVVVAHRRVRSLQRGDVLLRRLLRLPRRMCDALRPDGLQMRDAVIGEVHAFVELHRLGLQHLLIGERVRRRMPHQRQRGLIGLAQETDERLLMALLLCHVLGKNVRAHAVTPTITIRTLNY